MTRIEFLKSLGLSGATLFTVLATCTLESCSSKASDPTPATPSTGGTTNNTGNTGITGTNTGNSIDFTIDISNAANATLKNNGGALVSGDVIVARTNNGDYIALAKTCTHQGTTVDFQAAQNRFFCSNHGSVFNLTGSVVNGPALNPLKQFQTALSGNNLRVFA
ncbi:MAG: Rieske (2Fe-2S) protein [Cytophagales bacterium]|nr:MAG: Rieske (2Fe-2S) protein [Cytophagales bacterium]